MASGASFRLVDRACHFCGVRRQCLKWCVLSTRVSRRLRPQSPASTSAPFISTRVPVSLATFPPCQLVLAHVRTLLVLGMSAEHLCGFAARYHHLSAHMVQIFCNQIFSTRYPALVTATFSPQQALWFSILAFAFIVRAQVVRRVQLYMSVPGVRAEPIAASQGAWCVLRLQYVALIKNARCI